MPESKISFPSLDKSPINSLEPSLNNCVFPLVSDLPPSNSFKIHLDSYLYDLEDKLKSYMQIMAPLSHLFDAQNTLQLPNSPIGKPHNFMVSNTVSLVQVVIMYFFSFIGWFSMSLYIFELILHTF